MSLLKGQTKARPSPKTSDSLPRIFPPPLGASKMLATFPGVCRKGMLKEGPEPETQPPTGCEGMKKITSHKMLILKLDLCPRFVQTAA